MVSNNISGDFQKYFLGFESVCDINFIGADYSLINDYAAVGSRPYYGIESPKTEMVPQLQDDPPIIEYTCPIETGHFKTVFIKRLRLKF